MLLNKLRLTGFRNYEDNVFEFKVPMIVITGKNTAGKTNLLEAIYLLAETKSFRAVSNQTLINLVEKGRKCAGDEKAALISAQGSMTYRELWHGALGIASRLQQAGIGRGSRVGIWMEKSLACVQAIIGVLYSGAAYVPLDPRSPPKRCFRIAQDCVFSGWIVDEARFALLSNFSVESVPSLVLVETIISLAQVETIPYMAQMHIILSQRNIALQQVSK